ALRRLRRKTPASQGSLINVANIAFERFRKCGRRQSCLASWSAEGGYLRALRNHLQRRKNNQARNPRTDHCGRPVAKTCAHRNHAVAPKHPLIEARLRGCLESL